ncbi:MAG: hypothetical protein E7167_02975 [Firmicutes bacterium]|nr:hypothetical protein [Bacillota bacterium]
MAWNINELKLKIEFLESQIQTISDPTILMGLEIDLRNLKEMVNYKSGKKIYDIKALRSYAILDKQHLEEMVESLKKNSSSLARELYSASYFHHVGSRGSAFKSISDQENHNLLYEFLEYFDENLLRLYLEYQKEERIELNTNLHDSATCRGRCYPLVSEGNTYISSRFNNRFNSISILPHELAHAAQLIGKTSVEEMQKCLYSLFGEAYPIFVEYVFWDYLKNTKYRKQAFAQEANKINGFLCNLDYNATLYQAVQDIIYTPNGGISSLGYGKNLSSDTLLLSGILGMYWFFLYKQDPNAIKLEIEKFNQGFGTRYEGEIFDQQTTSELTSGVYWTIKDYLQNYRRIR